jgi:hypothetical protein
MIRYDEMFDRSGCGVRVVEDWPSLHLVSAKKLHGTARAVGPVTVDSRTIMRRARASALAAGEQVLRKRRQGTSLELKCLYEAYFDAILTVTTRSDLASSFAGAMEGRGEVAAQKVALDYALFDQSSEMLAMITEGPALTGGATIQQASACLVGLMLNAVHMVLQDRGLPVSAARRAMILNLQAVTASWGVG